MARKASIKNLRKAANDTAARVSELEKQLEEAKAKQAEAQNKVYKPRKFTELFSGWSERKN